MKQTDKQWWWKARADGRSRFVIQEGILRQGTRPAFVLALLAFAVGVGFWSSVWIFVFSSIVIGAVVGIAMWNQFQKTFHDPAHGNNVA